MSELKTEKKHITWNVEKWEHRGLLSPVLSTMMILIVAVLWFWLLKLVFVLSFVFTSFSTLPIVGQQVLHFLFKKWWFLGILFWTDFSYVLKTTWQVQNKFKLFLKFPLYFHWRLNASQEMKVNFCGSFCHLKKNSRTLRKSTVMHKQCMKVPVICFVSGETELLHPGWATFTPWGPYLWCLELTRTHSI